MLEAISTMVVSTIDLFIKLGSSEVNKRRLGKLLFETYLSLGDIAKAMERVEQTVEAISAVQQGKKITLSYSSMSLPDYIRRQSLSSDGTLTIRALSINDDGNEIISEPRRLRETDILHVALKNDIRHLSKSFRKLAWTIESDINNNLLKWRFRKKGLKAIEAFDDNLVDFVRDIWDGDGGFISAFTKLGLGYNFDQKIVEMIDSRLQRPIMGEDFHSFKKQFSLSDPEDVEKFIKIAQQQRTIIIESRDKLKDFIRRELSVEDVL